VAVIGTGLRRTHPAKNASLQRIAREAADISQFWPDAPPTKASFPMRNIVMSGLARAACCIGSAEPRDSHEDARSRSAARME
jgi:DNA processing protein